jgi:hypothetical protein
LGYSGNLWKSTGDVVEFPCPWDFEMLMGWFTIPTTTLRIRPFYQGRYGVMKNEGSFPNLRKLKIQISRPKKAETPFIFSHKPTQLEALLGCAYQLWMSHLSSWGYPIHSWAKKKRVSSIGLSSLMGMHTSKIHWLMI